MTQSQIYQAAGLTPAEASLIDQYLIGDFPDFYDTTAYDKLYEYFTFETGEMPYEVAKARTLTPDEWIIDRLNQLPKSGLTHAG